MARTTKGKATGKTRAKDASKRVTQKVITSSPAKKRKADEDDLDEMLRQLDAAQGPDAGQTGEEE